MPQWKILIVDDSPDDRAICRRRLQRDSNVEYLIEEADAGGSGLAACQTSQPDCILLDYGLPDLNGLQFLTRLSQQKGAQTPAIVMLTGIGDGAAIAVEAMKRGAQDYLRKGTLTTDNLGRAIANAIEKVGLQRALDAQHQRTKENETRLQLALEAAQMGAWEWNVLADTITWSANLSPMVGFTTDASPRSYEHFLALVHPEDRTRMAQAIRAALENERAYEIEFRFVLPGGSVRWSLTKGQVIRDAAGRALRMIGIDMDITERKQAEAEREQLLTELQRVNAELQQFAYIVSHDLNEPLRTMSSFVTLLAREYQGKLGATADEYIGFVTEGAQRMQGMLTDLLAYTRAGGLDLIFTWVDGESLLARVLTDLQMAIAETKAEITHDPLPTVYGEATRLGQVLQNLIGNALKFRGPVPPQIHISTVKEGHHWRFSVRDNGIGIDPVQARRLFQVFQRLHTTREYPGTGMGLAICRKIVERHGGRIWVESRPGEGSTFYFTIGDREEIAL